jgi:hypothetical protein
VLLKRKTVVATAPNIGQKDVPKEIAPNAKGFTNKGAAEIGL